MINFLLNGGWLMLPLVICSILSFAIIIERFWCLREKRIIPEGLGHSLLYDYRKRVLSSAKVHDVEQSSPLGKLLVTVLRHYRESRADIIQYVEDEGNKVIHKLENHLNLLGTIATISPLLGLLGTVIGMIDVFTVITQQGVGNPNTLAGGISEALITTAAGLTVAIPSLIFHRAFQRKIANLSHKLEHETLEFLDNFKDRGHEKKRVRVTAADMQAKDVTHEEPESSGA